MTLTFGVDTPCRYGPCDACNHTGFVRGPQAVARRTDPETSHEAAQSLGDLRKSRQYVYAVLLKNGPMSDHRLCSLTSGVMSESGARTRRSELVDRGLVVDSGEREVLPSGRRAVIWTVVK